LFPCSTSAKRYRSTPPRLPGHKARRRTDAQSSRRRERGLAAVALLLSDQRGSRQGLRAIRLVRCQLERRTAVDPCHAQVGRKG
jgi:hypothetical protein